MYKRFQQIHFVGIGGIGMSGIAEVMLNLGYRVTGSDIAESEITTRLKELGAVIHRGHDPKNLLGADVVVYSSAVKQDNPELVAAREMGIPVIPRAEMLAELMRLKYGIAVAGAHGKTTTTSMIATVLAKGGLDPTVVIGGRLNSLGSNAKLGQGEFLVAEADESDGSFLKLSPTIAVVTNIDREHLDHYRDVDEIRESFLQFINKIPFYGLAILCLDDEHIPRILPRVEKRILTYGLSSQADLQARNIDFKGTSSYFRAYYHDELLGNIHIQMPGLHNIYNALAAMGVALELEIPFKEASMALQGFSGVQRRFQVKAQIDDLMVVDDYGHHPSEIKATLKAAKEGWGKRLIVIFQPHRYTRTKALFDDFLTAFHLADSLIIMDIYPAGEEPIEGVHSSRLCEGIRKMGHRDVVYIPERERIVEHVLERILPDDLIITLGAGDVWKVGEEIINRIEEGEWLGRL